MANFHLTAPRLYRVTRVWAYCIRFAIMTIAIGLSHSTALGGEKSDYGAPVAVTTPTRLTPGFGTLWCPPWWNSDFALAAGAAQGLAPTFAEPVSRFASAGLTGALGPAPTVPLASSVSPAVGSYWLGPALIPRLPDFVLLRIDECFASSAANSPITTLARVPEAAVSTPSVVDLGGLAECVPDSDIARSGSRTPELDSFMECACLYENGHCECQDQNGQACLPIYANSVPSSIGTTPNTRISRFPDQPALEWMIIGCGLLSLLACLAAVLYDRGRWKRRFLDAEKLTAETFGLTPQPLNTLLSLQYQRQQESDRQLQRIRNERDDLTERLQEVKATLTAKRPLPGFNPSEFAREAAYWLRKTRETAVGLKDDPEFCDFYKHLQLHNGTDMAANALERCQRAGQREYEACLYEALATGQFDVALTSLDVLSVYAIPREGDWRPFLVCLETAEAILSLGLLACDIEIDRPALMMPVQRSHPGDNVNVGLDKRNLGAIQSALTEARNKSRMLLDDQVLIFDCYSPGWWSRTYAPRKAQVVLYDPASMRGNRT